jgi:uncharacterized protein
MQNLPQTPPEELSLAIIQFNKHEWFRCHETLEELWFGESGMRRDFYQGVLQISVALYHWRSGNFEGAMKLLTTGVEFLDKVDPVFMQVDVAGFTADSKRLRGELETLGKKRMAEMDEKFIPKMRLTHEAD